MKYDRAYVFEKNTYSDANKKFRWVREEIFEEYFSEITRYVKPNKISAILDIGCGTGQFAVNLARRCPDATVVALDSSESQLEKMNAIIAETHVANVESILSTFEAFHTDQLFDVIVCSEAIHLFDDLSLFMEKVSEILAPEGVLCIRTPSPKQYASRSIYNFFPRVRYINLEKCKGPELIDAACCLYGLHVSETIEIDESRQISASELSGMFHSKAFSTLHLLSDEEYDEGKKRINAYVAEHDHFDYDFKMTLYIIKH